MINGQLSQQCVLLVLLLSCFPLFGQASECTPGELLPEKRNPFVCDECNN